VKELSKYATFISGNLNFKALATAIFAKKMLRKSRYYLSFYLTCYHVASDQKNDLYCG